MKRLINKYLTLFLGVFIILTLTTCKVNKPNIIYVNKDSIITKTEIVYKDTLIKIPGDTIKFEVPCNKDTVFIYRSKSSSSLVQVKNGKISVQNNCDEKDLLITKLESQIEKYKTENKNTNITITKEVKYVPSIYKFFTAGFWLFLCTTIILTLINTGLWGLIIGGVVKIVSLITKRKKKDKN
jgi:hypothetical protein